LDVHSTEDIGEGLIELFNHYDFYQKQGYDRVMMKYTWNATAKTYLHAIKEKLSKHNSVKVELPMYFQTLDVQDLDNHFIQDKYKKN